jgi:SAM-dependent methyltransferase
MQPYAEDHSISSVNSSLNSAKEVVPFVIELIQPKHIIDVGCGLGAWLSVFKEHGVEDILGIDGDYVDVNKLKISQKYFMDHDLTKPLSIEKTFDLVVSLEVAEHLPAQNAESFVNGLVKLGPVILFSAALPYQPGEHHYNCQWPNYWANLFYKKGYVLFDCLRMKFWQNKNVDWWYSQNMLLFVRQSSLSNYPTLKNHFSFTTSEPVSLVHPELYQLQQTTYQNLEASKISMKSVLKRKIKHTLKSLQKRFS